MVHKILLVQIWIKNSTENTTLFKFIKELCPFILDKNILSKVQKFEKVSKYEILEKFMKITDKCTGRQKL